MYYTYIVTFRVTIFDIYNRSNFLPCPDLYYCTVQDTRLAETNWEVCRPNGRHPLSGCILVWSVDTTSKNGHNQNSFSEKHKNTVFLVTLAITTSDTNTTICGRVRGRNRWDWGCVRQKESFWGTQPQSHRLRPRTRPQIVVFVSEVVIAKVTKNTVFLCFSEKLFWSCPFFRGCVHAKMQPDTCYR